MRYKCHKCGNIWHTSAPAECIVQVKGKIIRCPKCGTTCTEDYKEDESKKVKE